MVISRDVEFNEKEAQDWKVNDGQKYEFLPVLEERYEDHQEPIVTPPSIPMSSTSSSSSFSYSSGSSSSGCDVLNIKTQEKARKPLNAQMQE